MSVQSLDHLWERMTPPRVRVAAALAEGATLAEVAGELSISVNGVRSTVRQLNEILGVSGVREIARFWCCNGEEWLAWCASQGRLNQRGDRRSPD